MVLLKLIELIENNEPLVKSNSSYKNGILVEKRNLRFGKAAYNLLKEINEYIEFEDETMNYNKLDKISGVYMIEDFYIGETGNLLNRIVSHLLEIFYEKYNKKYNTSDSYNKEKSLKIRKILLERKLKLKLIDIDRSKETYYINDKYKDLLLTNKKRQKTDIKI